MTISTELFPELQLVWEFQAVICCKAEFNRAYTELLNRVWGEWHHVSLKTNLRNLSDMKGMEAQSGCSSKVHPECQPIKFRVAASPTLWHSAPWCGTKHHLLGLGHTTR